MTKGFYFDLNRCTGCQACALACEIENELEPGRSWRQIFTYNDLRHPRAPLFHLSLACNHCAEPPCRTSCPALAYDKDPVTGIVNLDPDKCIGCKYCSWACPYDAPRYDSRAGVMKKCTFCHHRLAEGISPACVTSCPTAALQYGEVKMLSGAEWVPGFPDTGVGPSVRFAPLREPDQGPETSLIPGTDGREELDPASQTRGSRISLGSEWPLVGFTLLAAGLVAGFTGRIAATASIPRFLFLFLAATSLMLSSLHLGRRKRAWRAVLGLRTSWLSREIVFYTGFLGLSLLDLFFSPGPLFRWSALALGWGALLSMDRVYDVAVWRRNRPHSADVLLIGALFLGVLWANAWVWVLFSVLKLLLYLRQRWSVSSPGGGSGLLMSTIRVGAGLVVPPLLWLTLGEEALGLAWAGVVIGELIDRCEFYTELQIRSPGHELDRALQDRLLSDREPRLSP